MAAIIIPLLALGIIAAILLPVIRSTFRRPATKQEPAWPMDDGLTREDELRNRLDHSLFGEKLAGDLWHRLMRETVGGGAMYDFHKDFCGHALIRTQTGVMLCDSFDGGDFFGDPKAIWETKVDFTAFWARQSDYRCSGWDESEPIFFSDDSWYRNNQRLTRALLTRYIRGRQA